MLMNFIMFQDLYVRFVPIYPHSDSIWVPFGVSSVKRCLNEASAFT